MFDFFYCCLCVMLCHSPIRSTAAASPQPHSAKLDFLLYDLRLSAATGQPCPLTAYSPRPVDCRQTARVILPSTVLSSTLAVFRVPFCPPSSSSMSAVHQSSVTTVEEPLPTPGNSGAKIFFAVAGLGAGWVGQHSNKAQTSISRA